MKLIIMTMLTVFTISAQALSLGDVLPILIGGGGHQGQPGRPGYGGNVTCRATDNGWEEHSGGHFSCGECLQQHGDCNETCSTFMSECRVDGTDQTGRAVSFLGRGNDQWQAESDAIRACQYNYASNCNVVSCNQRENVLSRRSCRR